MLDIKLHFILVWCGMPLATFILVQVRHASAVCGTASASHPHRESFIYMQWLYLRVRHAVRFFLECSREFYKNATHRVTESHPFTASIVPRVIDPASDSCLIRKRMPHRTCINGAIGLSLIWFKRRPHAAPHPDIASQTHAGPALV